MPSSNPAHPPAEAPAPSSDPPKLTGPELKKAKQAEKAARRAQAVLEKGQPPPAAPRTSTAQNAEGGKAAKGQQQRRVSNAAAPIKNMPIRSQKAQPVVEEPAVEDKTVEVYRHLRKPRTTGLAGANKDVHSAVLALGLQMSDYTICGSSARLVATLQAFKKVIQSYTTPPGNTLTRHFTSHVLSPQIEYLSSCRPLSISMGNAIRWLKLEISKVDIDTPDHEAKNGLCDAIDNFIRERVTLAGRVIAGSAAEKIRHGDVILTFAKSSVVQRALVQAHESGKRFSVISVDDRPLHEGKHLKDALINLGMDVTYCPSAAMSESMKRATKVLLGAHAMMSNGRLYSRAGTAKVGMEANTANVPVLVLCETIKFTERAVLDSIPHNEIPPADELALFGGATENWRDIKGLQLCDPLYDVTPADFIQMIVTESGRVPPTSVPVLHRLGNESQV
ncbi:hypothetical protein BJ875DRAFT_100860 [Amylocarpus encephaloides]|uniref:Translation initiation factor eIF2B subunit delta n=1 Tax=Amylocarpus encephaloides TaxID=45428 RepID=A0A9P7YE02_9HELO|nr:hypothetical protein BJ875DRAFT_100860 [Amylocarpus encephaloides]